MSAMEEEEEALERELEEQIVENKSSLVALQEALLNDPDNVEISSLAEELEIALRESEESLLYFKRKRLLREVDRLQPEEEVKPEVEEINAPFNPDESEPSPFALGSKCRFRYTDGRWYNGKVIDLCNDGTNASVSFLTPTHESMQMCRFYLQQRCRFGDNCRSSHGSRIQTSALKQFIQPNIEVGSKVLACASDGLWRDAEVEELVGQQVGVVFIHDGSRSSIQLENLVNSVQESDRGSSSSSESEDEDIPSMSGFNQHFAGVQTETVTFAHWEKHTRGVASKLMAKMGYTQGSGLGSNGQGLLAPVPVRVLPQKTSLDFISRENGDIKEKTKKKSRGGKRKRDKKFAEAARAMKEEEEGSADVFDFINVQLSAKKQIADKESDKRVKVKEDRMSMIKQEDEIKELIKKVSKLEEMVQRNRKEKAVYEAVCKKLEEAQRELSNAEAAHNSTVKAVKSKEQEKKWLKF